MIRLAVNDSLNQSIDQVVKRYSSLFKLPSYVKSFLLLASLSMLGSVLSMVFSLPSLEALGKGGLLGLSILLANSFFDYIVSSLVLGRDPIYDLRRTTGLSFFSWTIWVAFIFVGGVISISFGFLWQVRLILLGFSAVLILRLIVFSSTASISRGQLLTASILQPFPCVVLFMLSWTGVNYFSISLFLAFSLIVGFLSTLFLISSLNQVGDRTLGIASLSLFKSFLLNWITGSNAPLEELLEELGKEQDVKISLIKFDASKPKAVIAVPSIHPGPFKNVGSSLLPSMVKNAIEKELNCVASVPHGLLGHELDLASTIQNIKIINHVIDSLNFDASEARATPFVKFSNGTATTCCQLFGNSAFVSFSLSPSTTEDLPQELEQFVNEEAEKHGLSSCTVVNAHNSIDGSINTQKALQSLKDVAVHCLEKAATLPNLPFRVGAATILPKEFSLKDGMGPGGITVIVIEVGKQKIAYVTIDGNNMVTGLREEILMALQSEGINEGEVFTTDTHSVNAIVLTGRGYNPIGEAIDHGKLIEYIKKTTSTAISDLESAKMGGQKVTVSKVKVIGEERLEALCLLAERTIRKAKKVSIPIFAATGLLLTSYLMLLL